MKKITLFVSRAMLVYMAAVLVCFSPAHVLANHRATVVKNIAPPKAQPFCSLTLIDHRGHSTKLNTNVMHASHTTLTVIFNSGEKLILKFSLIRAGHFFAESARSKEPQILFYPAHSSHPLPMVGAVVISSIKPLSGNFSHLMSDDDNVHLNLVSGTFSF
nr:hypothetical protein [uncultured Mucilaginibacter sp.]